MKPKSEGPGVENKEAAIGPTTGNESHVVGPSEEEIRQRAYEIHLEHGGTDGQDMDDWLQAERELKARYSAK